MSIVTLCYIFVHLFHTEIIRIITLFTPFYLGGVFGLRCIQFDFKGIIFLAKPADVLDSSLVSVTLTDTGTVLTSVQKSISMNISTDYLQSIGFHGGLGVVSVIEL